MKKSVTLNVEIPEIVAQELGDEPEKALLEPWLIKLAKRGDLLVGDIQKILNLSRLEAIQWFGKHQIDWMALTEEDLIYGKEVLKSTSQLNQNNS